MCGINGIFDIRKKNSPKDLAKMVHTMNDKIIYRGPDAEGLYTYDNLSMGMRRLSIIDLKSGNQPIYNEDKTIAVVFNGEIYNFQKLRNELESKGHIFTTNSDTEVIVHGYEEYGTDIFDKLDGMYGLSLHDQRKKQIYIARDRMGEKPLHYYKGNEFIIWGSEIKSLLSTGLIDKKINKRALNQYLQLTYIPAPLTIFEGIYKLLPGHYLMVTENGEIKDVEYWSLRNIKDNNEISYEEAKTKLRGLIETSVRERMVSDVQLGAFLSGGVDSGTIVGLMSKSSDEKIKTFTIGFNEKEYDERNEALKVSELNNTEHHVNVLGNQDILDSIDEILSSMDEPFADPSILPTYFVSKHASNTVKVVLTGDAGDELFLGYNKYLISYYGNLYNKLPKPVKAVFENEIKILPKASTIYRKINKVVTCSNRDMLKQRKDIMCRAFNEEGIQSLLQSEYYLGNSISEIDDRYNELIDSSDLKRTQYVDMSILLEGDMLAKVDRMSMRNSIETRVPFLSKDVVEFAYSLPDEYKLKGKELKRILKDSMADILPKGHTKLAKKGFAVPLDIWFKNEMRDKCIALTDKNFIEEQGIFNPKEISKIVDEHLTGKRNRKYEIWTLMVFQTWYKRYF
jgi:asparagine synthase (glutamine-hydrolysing)